MKPNHYFFLLHCDIVSINKTLIIHINFKVFTLLFLFIIFIPSLDTLAF